MTRNVRWTKCESANKKTFYYHDRLFWREGWEGAGGVGAGAWVGEDQTTNFHRFTVLRRGNKTFFPTTLEGG